MKVNTVIKTGTLQTLCRQCGIRCAVNVHIQDGKIKNITGFDGHPQNYGAICAKAQAAKDIFYHKDRLLKPLKKGPDGSFVEISRNRALDEITDKIRQIREQFGARSMGVWKGEGIGTFQEEDYVRRFIHAFGSPNYFSNDSACFNGRYLGFLLVNGFWNSSPEYEHADLIILWGTNPPASHPPVMPEIKEARKKGAKLIVIDPRLTKVAHKADIVARPLPGTDGALAWGLNRYLIETKNFDQKFIEKYAFGFEAFARYAEQFTPDFVEQQTGVNRDTVVEIAELIIKRRPRVIIYPGLGLEHHENGVNTVRTIACLESLCGALDIKGGVNWTEGMGERKLSLCDEVSLLDQKPIGADKFPVLYDFRWECHTMMAMDYMLGKGEYPLKGLIISAANPAITNPNSKKVAKALSNLDLFVVNDLFLTETAKMAHYVFPAASFLERSELHYHPKFHLVTLSRKIAEIPGVYDEYSLWRDLAHRLGFGERYFPWKNEEEVNRWILEPTGITLQKLRNHPEGIVYKPINYKKYETQPFPTPSGKIEFSSPYLKKLGLPEIPEYIPPRYISHPKREYPFVLTTGARKSLYCHSRYLNIPKFRKVFPVAEVEIHPADAARLGIEDKERLRVISKIGSVEVRAKIVHETQIMPGFLEICHGWQDGNVNRVTDDYPNDPISGFPLLKAVPVRVEKISK
jgi:anaerobic selenocysteine-containing dehydrogenase